LLILPHLFHSLSNLVRNCLIFDNFVRSFPAFPTLPHLFLSRHTFSHLATVLPYPVPPFGALLHFAPRFPISPCWMHESCKQPDSNFR
jgi:hypothetical protein